VTGDTAHDPVAAPSPRRRGDYGIDGDFRTVSPRGQLAVVAAITALLAGLTALFATVVDSRAASIVTGLVTLAFVLAVASYVHTTRVGKFVVWSRILADLHLRGDEEVLDLGCGRGALLTMVAELLPAGRAVGIDLWRTDQSGNSAAATLRNAELEGVADRVEVRTGDVTKLPFADDGFDLVVSNLVLHNLPTADGRRAALDEAVRVLRPGGRIVIGDLLHTADYRARLGELGLSDVGRRGLGRHMWWGAPFLPTRLVTGRCRR
jgi:SAM-dependent methyltransferase